MNKRQNIIERMGQGVFFLDGAFGTQVQNCAIPESDWNGHAGCNEYLNLARPDIVERIHRDYLLAGADAIETNTFGAAPSTLAEYGLAEQATDINRAAVRCARGALESVADTDRPRYIFGSIGPGAKLVSLGQTDFDRLRSDYRLQIGALLEGGADGILLETCQDLLQVKAGIRAFRDVAADDRSIPLYVSVTIEESGAMLVGSSIEAVTTALAPLPVSVLGLNCATGPRAMRRHLEYLDRNWDGLIAAMPNAGMPVLSGGVVSYPLGPEEFAAIMAELARAVNLNLLGGCCGTTPRHIECLAEAVRDFQPAQRAPDKLDRAASLYSPVDLDQQPGPLYIGERANATGSRAFRQLIEAADYDGALEILLRQEEVGAHMLDLNVAYPGGEEQADMEAMVARAARECRLPLMIDSTSPAVIEAALKHYGGRAFINSINFEDGEERALHIAGLARDYGAGLVGLTIDEEGMAKSAERKLEIATRLVRFCEERCGIGRGSLLIDPLTFTVASGDESLQSAALETARAIEMIKRELPGVRVMLGASNISYGLKPPARRVVNAAFLDMALRAGMDAAIVNVAALAPLNAVDPEQLARARALLENERAEGDPLIALIEHFEREGQLPEQESVSEDLSDEELVFRNIVRGRVNDSELIARLLDGHSAEDILNQMLVPAMAEVGRLFNDGILQLPFVLKSAEVMKKTVDLIRPHMRRAEDSGSHGRMLLATVAGDVHDIGKNLVDIILSNNGFEVVNLGTKMSAERILAAVREHRPDVVGLSGLLVKSTAVMADTLRYLRENDVRVPVFLGGAALTADFVARQCAPNYDGAVIYCRDAFAGLDNMRRYMDEGRLESEPPSDESTVVVEAADSAPIDIVSDFPVPAPPFIGYRIAREIDIDEILPLLNMRALYRGRWGYRQRGLDDAEYAELLEREVEPRFRRMLADCRRRGLFQPQAAWGYYRCHSQGDALLVDGPDGEISFHFPRREAAPRISLADFFSAEQDIAPFMVVTMGAGYAEECARLHAADEYEQYFLFHGLQAELTDALALLWHSRIRAELGFPDPDDMSPDDHFKGRYRGQRFGFGYSACPDTVMNSICCRLVHAEEIGVTTTESGMMIPEVSTAVIVLHNSRACHF